MVITNEQVKQLSSMLADAFADTPTFYYIMKNDHDFRIKNLKYLFACNIEIMLNKSKESIIYEFNDNGEPVSFHMFVPSDLAPVSLLEMIRVNNYFDILNLILILIYFIVWISIFFLQCWQ